VDYLVLAERQHFVRVKAKPELCMCMRVRSLAPRAAEGREHRGATIRAIL
jgi:hypothetical protein